MDATNIKKSKYRQKEAKNVYCKSQITKTIMLPISAVGKGIHETIERTVGSMVESKCIVEGFVKKGSVRVITYSSGLLKGENVLFDVVFECEVCYPVSGMLLNCVAKNITKAGIRAESATDIPTPVVVFIAKDHHYNIAHFNDVKEGDKINVRIIGQRFELNDKYVSIIGELVKPSVEKEFGFPTEGKKMPRIVIEDE